MILARAAGIPVFVTGGIGGVHRGAEQCEFLKKKKEKQILRYGCTHLNYSI